MFLSSKLLGKCGVFWSQLDAEIEAFQMHLVTTTYRDIEMAAGKAECWLIVFTMVRVIWRELIKVQAEMKIKYESDTPELMMGPFLWGILQVHRVMDDFLRNQLFQHP